MGRRLEAVMAGVILCLTTSQVWAVGVVRGLPLAQMMKDAQTIVVVSVESYTPDPGAAAELAALKASGVQSTMAEVARTTVRTAGAYKFKRLVLVKGDCEAALHLELPALSAISFGLEKIELPENAQALLFLKKNGEKWEPVDPNMPYVPLAANANATIKSRASGKDASPQAPDTLDAIVCSLTDAALRPALLTRLRDVEDKRLVEALHPYLDEKDRWGRDCLLNCLAIQQDVAAIPLIATLADDSEKQYSGWGSGTAAALQFYKKAEAVPYLNPLIVEGTNYVRKSAMIALEPIANGSSIPYLMKALDHEDEQHTVVYSAYSALHRVIGPALPPALARSEFNANKEQEIRTLKQWWEASTAAGQ